MAPEAVGSNPIARPMKIGKKMTSSLKKLKDLERSLTVSIEKDLYKSKFDEKISNLKKNVKLDGLEKVKSQMMLLNKDMEHLFMQRS